MNLLSEIQASLVQEDTGIAPAILKLRLLASHLGSDVLEKWVKLEAEGYPEDVPVPDYRKLYVSYTGTFMASNGATHTNAIPPSLIKKYAGEQWVRYEERQHLAIIDESVRSARDEGKTLGPDSADLPRILGNKIHEGGMWVCVSAIGKFADGALVGLQSAVRNRLLELTMELKKKIPAAADIAIESQPSTLPEKDTAIVHQIVNNTIGNITIGPGAQVLFGIEIKAGDPDSLAKALIKGGMPEAEAEELTKIASTKGRAGAMAWLQENVGKFANNVSLAVITDLLIKFFGG